MGYYGDDFIDRYMITSSRGRVWTRDMVRKAALRQVKTSPLPVRGQALGDFDAQTRARLVDMALDDDSLMRRHAGMVPARVVEAIEERVWELLHAET
jgi:hypothetical protein